MEYEDQETNEGGAENTYAFIAILICSVALALTVLHP